MRRVLGLDIGANSIGYSLLELTEQNNQIVFEDLVSNSIVFSEPNEASERREARGSRRNNARKSARKKYARKIFTKYKISEKEFISNPTVYLNRLDLKNLDVYSLREEAIDGRELSKEEFLFATYSILTDRGYNNMFSTSKEDGVINDAVLKNRENFLANKYALPSMVLTEHRKALSGKYQNIAIRNKKEDYKNSLDREMHKEEFKALVLSQSENRLLFKSKQACEEFIEELIDEEIINAPFYQRPLKSFENMVEYCTFYDKFNPKGSYKRTPLANVRNIELTLRQKIDNYEVLNNKSGEIKSSREMFSNEEIDEIIEFWVNKATSNEINAKNIFKSAGFKDLVLKIPENSSQVVLNIQAHRNILTILDEYKIDFQKSHNDFYNAILLELYYYKNESSRVEKINQQIKKYDINLDKNFAKKLSKLENMDGFSSFSLKFIDEVLNKMKHEDKTHHEALESLGYYSKYVDMPSYDYLPPLEPTKKDIEWLKQNIDSFDTKHIFYQPMMSPKVKRVIAVLRKLINSLIEKYGKIDEIRIETAKEMNSKAEKEKIDKSQTKNRNKNSEAIKFLGDELVKSNKNIEIAKLFKEQGGKCFYSGETITKDEAFNESKVEREHFIPRSTIWINSYKNKILVKKKYNQNKHSQHPIAYLKSIGEWENFKGRVKDSFLDVRKKEWLTDEELINSVMNKEHWQESYLNDTRSATRTIQKYLNHYLYPQEVTFGKGQKRSIFSVSGRAISELKYMWGVHTIMPKNKDDKKDRNTNYHHTLDAFTVALCSPTAINALHAYFKKRENKFKAKAMKEKIANELPKNDAGLNVVEYLKDMVKKYENNQKYVVPYSKRKTNMKGFKDGNKKLYITKNSNEEILSELEIVPIDSSILVKKVGLSVKDRSDGEVEKYIKSIQDRLDVQKQKKIIEALDTYVKKLLELRSEIKGLDKEIKTLDKKRKNGEKYKEHNRLIREEMKPYIDDKKVLLQAQKDLKCTFKVKNGKEQIVRSVRLPKVKVEKTKADAIIFHQRKKHKIERLNLDNFKRALEEKEPFVVKENESTLYVELFNTKNRGQAVGLNYFSSIANKIELKFNSRYKDELNSDSVADLVLYKNDIIKVVNSKKGSVEYFIFNGGGHVAGTNNKLSIKKINLNSLIKVKKDGTVEEEKESTVTPNKTTIISKVKIDILGNIEEN